MTALIPAGELLLIPARILWFSGFVASGELEREGNEVQRGAIRARIISGEEHAPGTLPVLPCFSKKIYAREMTGNGHTGGSPGRDKRSSGFHQDIRSYGNYIFPYRSKECI
jgi:hypothetical protein